MSYILHYAPDNASLIIRLALEHRGIAYRTRLVDRSVQGQRAPDYLELNPNGLIPVLETQQGALFETGAILLWLADTHGGLGPSPNAPDRGDFLKWLFFVANTLHPALQTMFYPHKFIAADHEAPLRTGIGAYLATRFETLNTAATDRPAWLGGPTPTVLDFYVSALLRWSALYPAKAKRDWFDLTSYPALARVAAQVEQQTCTQALQKTEGLGKTPFTCPQYPNPPIGSAT